MTNNTTRPVIHAHAPKAMVMMLKGIGRNPVINTGIGVTGLACRV